MSSIHASGVRNAPVKALELSASKTPGDSGALVICCHRVIDLCFGSRTFFRRNLGNRLIQLSEWVQWDADTRVRSLSLGVAAQEMWWPRCTSATACPGFCDVGGHDELGCSHSSSCLRSEQSAEGRVAGWRLLAHPRLCPRTLPMSAAVFGSLCF